jgi:tight adherence protein B
MMKSFLLFVSSALAMTTIVSLLSLKFTVKKEKILKAHKQASHRALWLAQARVDMSVSQFWTATLLCGTFAFAVLELISRTPLIAFVLALGVSFVPYIFIARKRAAISKSLVGAWPEALRDISASVSSGRSLSFALHSLAQVGPEELRPHFMRFATLERTLGFTAALEVVRSDLSDATSDRILEILVVANDRGGKIVKDILDDLISATLEDIALAETIATESLEMKINSRAVIVLPWCVLLVLVLTGSVFRDFYQSKLGGIVIIVGLIMSAGGIAILSRLTRVDLEPRVFSNDVKVA